MLREIEDNPLVRALSEALSGLDVYLVGGVVRDALLGKPCLDVDAVLVPKADPPGEFKRALSLLEKRFGIRGIKSQFFTGKFSLGEGEVDLALARTEEYPEPGSLPAVRPAFSLEEDLRRRDFTVNAIALSMSGQMIDPLGGEDDLRARVLRVIYRGSFKDDPTRALRAIRYRYQLGFSYARETEEEFALARKHMASVSFERIKHELERSSERPERMKIWPEMVQRGLLRGKIPSIGVLEALSERVGFTADSWVMFYGLISEDIPVGLTRKERGILSHIIANKLKEFSCLSEAHEALRKAPDEAILVLGVLNPLLEDYRKMRPVAKPLIKAEEMEEMGFVGAKLGRAILELEKARLEGKLKTRAEEADFLRGLS
ncbi:MAG: hypothetical protein ABIM74_04895 [candidate division WOR-3 bacterium]